MRILLIIIISLTTLLFTNCKSELEGINYSKVRTKKKPPKLPKVTHRFNKRKKQMDSDSNKEKPAKVKSKAGENKKGLNIRVFRGKDYNKAEKTSNKNEGNRSKVNRQYRKKIKEEFNSTKGRRVRQRDVNRTSYFSKRKKSIKHERTIFGKYKRQKDKRRYKKPSEEKLQLLPQGTNYH